MPNTNIWELHQDVGELQSTVRTLTIEVQELKKEVKELVGLLNQGRGAKYLLFVLPSVVGALSGVLGYFGVHWTVNH